MRYHNRVKAIRQSGTQSTRGGGKRNQSTEGRRKKFLAGNSDHKTAFQKNCFPLHLAVKYLTSYLEITDTL